MRPSHRRSRWLCASIAPWALAGGVIVSFTASAGDAARGRTDIAPAAAETTRILAGAASPLRDDRVRVASLSSDWPLAERAPTLERTRGALSPHDDLEPRPDLKHAFAHFPDVDRTLKGDPILVLRPTLSRAPAGGASTPSSFDVEDDVAEDRRWSARRIARAVRGPAAQ
jgi:hypothetical protein